MTTLYIMMGYPGSGKTTTSRVIGDLTGAEHLWADHIRCQNNANQPTYTAFETKALYKHVNELADKLLSSGKSVIYDTSFNHYADRQTMRNIASKYNAQVKLIWVVVPQDIARGRATKNAHKQGTRILGNMPEDVFNHLTGILEEPRLDEDVVILDGTLINADYVNRQLGLN